ncbi:MAG: hypothetical protein H7Z39_02375, partial [Burkholderiaceae bacterium]|nr:hypothetical protein [Burkholderiaceae bacterium]
MQAKQGQRPGASLSVAFSADPGRAEPTLGEPPEIDGLAMPGANRVESERAQAEMRAIHEGIARVEAEAKAACAAETRALAEARARAAAEERAAMDSAAAAAALQNAQAIEEAIAA